MTDPWSATAALLFRSAGSIEATYTPRSGQAVAVRVIPSSPDAMARFSGGSVVEGTNVFQLLLTDAPDPRSGDTIQTDRGTFVLYGDPTLDAEGTTWTCPANPQ